MIPYVEIQKWADKRWPEVLKAELRGEAFFPKTVKKRPFPDSMSTGEQFSILEEVRNNAKELVSIGEKIDMRGFGYTYHIAEKGLAKTNREARLLEFTTLNDYLRFIGKQEEFENFRTRGEALSCRFPELKDWMVKNALKVIELESLWDRIVAVLDFFQANPMPNLYLRELLASIDTKFIERNVKLFDTLLEKVLPDEAIDRGEEIFEKKYGLQWVEPLIRICFLNEEVKKVSLETYSDFGLPVRTLAKVNWSVKRVLVVENLTTLMSLRDRGLSDVIGMHGHGYRVANFGDLSWLNNCELYYWGDIDVQGFEILSLFRRKFHHAKSILMNCPAIDSTPLDSRGVGKPSKWRSEPKLTDEEYQAYRWAREGWRQIEQENLPRDLVSSELSKFF